MVHWGCFRMLHENLVAEAETWLKKSAQAASNGNIAAYTSCRLRVEAELMAIKNVTPDNVLERYEAAIAQAVDQDAIPFQRAALNSETRYRKSQKLPYRECGLALHQLLERYQY